jgi:hypothetical protein
LPVVLGLGVRYDDEDEAHGLKNGTDPELASRALVKFG